MQTKKDEIIITSSDISELKGNYLAERLLRTWSEDFVDEETGETVSIERNEILFERGILLDSKILSEINFFLQSGDIKSVKASNQERTCTRAYGQAALWQVQILLNSKKKTLFLYANSVENAMDIVTDFVEQKYAGRFNFTQLKEIDFSVLLYDEENGDECDIYRMEIEMAVDDEKYNNVYIVQGTDAEHCKNIINDYIAAKRIKANKPVDYELTIISAKTITCHDIIDPEFCKAYQDENS